MLHGLMHDSAVVGTYKHAKHSAKKKAHYNSSVSDDIRDLVNGFRQIRSEYRKMKKSYRKVKMILRKVVK